ncbi:MAG: CRTAC1 family protein [Myxococcaceae bacterium]
MKPRVLLALAILLVAALGGVVALRHHRPRMDMVARLAELAAREGVWDNPWDKTAEKIAELRKALTTERDPRNRFTLEREIAAQAVYAGDVDQAISTLEDLQRELGTSMPPDAAEAVKADLAFAQLRRGETENCAEHHTPASCIFPIGREGVHQLKRGSSRAVELYGELLSDPATNPENALSYRWLMNIGHMTLGTYPDGVPAKWLIPPEAFRSDADIGRFPDVAASRGVVEFGAAGGLILEDLDNDGRLDMLISHMGMTDQLEYFHNDGNGHFTRRTEEAGLKGLVGGLDMFQADYDNDGCIDVFIPRGAWRHAAGKIPGSLLHNNCNGTFTDVTYRAGLGTELPSQTAAWADINHDGLLDLFVGYEISSQVEWPKGTINFQLYLNNGDGTFTDVGPGSGIEVSGMVKAAVWGDIDNDGWPDLYVSMLDGPNHLFRNLGTGKRAGAMFTDVTARAGVAEPRVSFTTWFFDYDNDGWLDIFVTGYLATLPNIVREVLGQKDQAQGERPRLYHNNRDGTFTDVSRQVGLDKLLLTMGANVGDLDNDGWLDFYLGTGAPPLTTLVPNRMFRNDRGRAFQDVTTSGGFGNLQKGHGVAFGDVDNSGNQDVVEVMGGVYASDRFWTSLYKNPGHGNHWVKLQLVGKTSNRFGVGARIRLVLPTAEGGRREVFALVGSGGSFGASSLRPHLGLGEATTIELLEVRWPGGKPQTFRGLAADRTYELHEDEQEARVLPVPRRASATSPR